MRLYKAMKRLLILCFASLGLLQSAYAQEASKFEYAAGPSFGVGFGMDNAYSLGIGALGGYKFNEHFAAGVCVDFMNFFGRPGLYYTYTGMPAPAAYYHAIRPQIYCRYNFLPDEEWDPYVGARLGYALVLEPQFRHHNGLYTAIDLGVFHHTGDNGKGHTLGVSIETPYLQYLLRRCVSRK